MTELNMTELIDRLILEEKLETYRDMKRELQPAIDHMNSIAKEIRALSARYEWTYEIPGASVTYKSGYTRPKWNTAAMDAHIALYPRSMLTTFRGETKVKPTGAIKVNGK